MRLACIILIALSAYALYASDSDSSSTGSHSYERELVALSDQPMPGVFAIQLPDTQPDYALGVVLSHDTSRIDPETLREYRPQAPLEPEPRCRCCRNISPIECLFYGAMSCLIPTICGLATGFIWVLVDANK